MGQKNPLSPNQCYLPGFRLLGTKLGHIQHLYMGQGGEFGIWKNEPFPEFTGLSTFVSTSFVQGCNMVKDNIDIVMVLETKFDSAFPNAQYVAEDMLLHLEKIEIIMVLKFYFLLEEIYLLPWQAKYLQIIFRHFSLSWIFIRKNLSYAAPITFTKAASRII